MATILIIEDEHGLARSIMDAMQFHGYATIHASNGTEGLRLAGEKTPDAIILDVMLPDIDGFEVCRSLRSLGVSVPILMLTARSDETDRVVGLEIGADDYITKPFSTRELVARVKAHLRRSVGVIGEDHEYHFGGIIADTKRCRLVKNGQSIQLTSTEAGLLEFLIQNRNKILTREEIMNHVQGYDYYPNSRTIDNHIMNLRHKIEEDPHKPEWILTVHRQGYRFVG